jgi:Zn-dependent protease
MTELIFLSSTSGSSIEEKIILFVVLLGSLSVHEWAHAITADKLGDPLPRAEGRVTLDPRAHIDPIGTILLPLIMIFASPGFAIFGWGKPVRISLPNPKTRKRDDILITIAGPLSNLIIALLATLFFSIWVTAGLPLSDSGINLYQTIVFLNCVLFVFNLMPIPPLDGSHILKHAINMKDETYFNLSRYGFIILLVLINLPPFQIFMGSMIQFSSSVFFGLFKLLAL